MCQPIATAIKFSLFCALLTAQDVDAYNHWLRQIDRCFRVTTPNAADQVGLFLLCAGTKSAKYYNEVTWPLFNAGLETRRANEIQKAADFVTRKFAAQFSLKGLY